MPQSFDQIARDNRARLVRIAIKHYVRCPSAAEDVVQNTLLKAWQLYPDAQIGPDEKDAERWLNEILKNTALNYRREKRRQRENFLADMGKTDSGFDAEYGLAQAMGKAHGNWHASTYGSQSYQDLIRDIEQASATLTPEQCAALEAAAEGYTVAEIAAVQQIPLGAARDRVRRGREVLREALA